MKKRYSKSEKAGHWHNWKSSGMKQLDYCQRHGLNRNSFKNWAPPQTQFPLVPVAIEPPIETCGIKLTWCDCTIELPRNISAEEWQCVLTALKETREC